MSRMRWSGLAGGAVLVFSSGCSTFHTIADNAASQAVGSMINRGDATQDAQTSNTPPPTEQETPPPAEHHSSMMAYSPQMAPYYSSFLFTMAFNPGGLSVTNTQFKTGQYARWSWAQGESAEKGGWIERARLADDASGNQWWKVKFHDEGSGETTILEGLFNQNRTKLVRLRAQFPGDKSGNEVPVMEQQYYVPAQTLSPESLSGATVGTDKVTTPAGNFNAKHVVFGGGGGSLEWWISDQVPGGLVKQFAKSASSGDSHGAALLQLEAYGTGAVSELGSK